MICPSVPLVTLPKLTRPALHALLLELNDEVVTLRQTVAELRKENARLKSLSASAPTPTLRVGRLVLNLDYRRVNVDGESLHFPKREYAVLELLLRRHELIVTNEDLVHHLNLADNKAAYATVKVYISNLRKTLARAKTNTEIITVRSRGHILRESLPEN